MIFNHEEHEDHEDIQSPKSAIIKKIRTATARRNSTKPPLANRIPTATALPTEKRMRTETAQGTLENRPPWTMTASTTDWKARPEQPPAQGQPARVADSPDVGRTGRARRLSVSHRQLPQLRGVPGEHLKDTVFFVPVYMIVSSHLLSSP